MAVVAALLLTACGGKNATDSSLPYDITSASVTSHEAVSQLTWSRQEAKLVKNPYDPNDVFVVTVDASEAPYCADKTGALDSTKAINNALSDCQIKYGGGTVYLPAGNYKITGMLNVYADVTLVGDYNDPDKAGFDGDYGTVISAYVKTDKETGRPLVSIDTGSGIKGLTFYYPDQSAVSPKEYPYAIHTGTSWNMISDITFINAYRGIAQSGVASPDMGDIFASNVKGTVLYQGYLVNNAGDAVFIDKISFSPTYWAKSGKKYNAPKESDIRSWMSKNSHVGLYTSGLEGGMFSNISVDNFVTGVAVEANAGRKGVESYGDFINLTVKKSTDAMLVNKSFSGMGIQVTEASLEATGISFRNKSSNRCYLHNVTGTGKIDGHLSKTTSEATPPVADDTVSRPTRLELYNVLDYGADKSGKEDASKAVQAALDAAGKDGGGYVYMPGGRYRLDKPVEVPSNTQLCGTSSNLIGTSRYGGGTNVFAYYGVNKKASATALITLEGDGAGVSGLHIYYPKNGNIDVDNIKTKSYPYTVRGKADGVYCESLSIFAAANGIEMSGAENFVITRIITTCFDNVFSVKKSNNGLIHMSMQHPGYMTAIQPYSGREDFSSWVSFENTGKLMQYTGYRLSFAEVKDSKNVLINNTFGYHMQDFVKASDSSVTCNNAFARFTDGNTAACIFELDGGSLTAFGIVYKSAHVHRGENTGTVRIYNAHGVGTLSGGDINP